MDRSNDIQSANDSRRCKRDEGGTCTFPAPATTLVQSHSIASTNAVPGLWAFTSSHTIVVAKSADLPRTWPLFQFLDGSGWDIYTSVSFCQAVTGAWPIPDSPLVAASMGGIVRIFNLENNATIKFHTCHNGHKAIAEWSPRYSRHIYAADDVGQLSIWDVLDNSSVLLSFPKLNVTCLAVSPHEDDIVALGDKDGMVRIVNTSGTGTVIHNMTHESEIFSLAWKLSGKWSTVTKLRKQVEPFLVASSQSFKPPCVRVWDRDGKDIITLSLTEADGTQRKLLMRSVPCLWVRLPSNSNPKDSEDAEVILALLSIGSYGEILCWKENDGLPDIIHELHKCCTVSGLIQSGDILWSISSEPYIIGWNLRFRKVEMVIPTYSGISSVSASSIEHTRLAVGGVDSFIRVLKLESEFPVTSASEVPLVPFRIQGKVTAVAWHPWLDKLALGTDAGVLGIFDVKNESRYVKEFTKKVGGTIYTLDWGPKTYTRDFQSRDTQSIDSNTEDGQSERRDSLWLYAYGNRSVFSIHPGKRENALVNIGRVISISNERPDGRVGTSISEIKWTPDQIYFAVGYSDGKIEIFIAPHLMLRCWIKCHSSGIQYLSWRSLDFIEGAESRKEKLFASAANDGTAKVYDLTQLYDPDFMANPKAPVLQFIKCLSFLNGHRGLRVIQVAWSPHNDNHILTVSYDRTAVLWNLKDRSRIARYMGHDHRLVACAFHPLNPNLILTCSDDMVADSCFHIWDYRQHAEVDDYLQKMESMIGSDAEAVKAVAAPLPKLMFCPGEEDAAVGKDKEHEIPIRQDANAKFMSKIRGRMTGFPLLRSSKNGLSLNQLLEMTKSDGQPGIDPSTLTDFELEVLAAEEKALKSTDKVTLLAKNIEAMSLSGDTDELDPKFPLGLFGTSEDALKIVGIELDRHIKRKDWDSATCLLPWLPNPQLYIEKIVSEGHMSESLVIFSKKCSRTFQLKMAENYATYLILNGRLSEALKYCFLILESSEMTYTQLTNNSLWLEALIFSKHHPVNQAKDLDYETLCRFTLALRGRNVSEDVIRNIFNIFGADYDSSLLSTGALGEETNENVPSGRIFIHSKF